MRWIRYVRTVGSDFDDLWGELAKDPVLVILGGGFDPRVPRAVSRIIEVASAQVDVLRVDLGAETSDPPMQQIAANNRVQVDEMVSSAGGAVIEQPFPEVHARRSIGLSVSREFHQSGLLERYRQIAVDVSGLPRSVYFPLLRGLLTVGESWGGDVHVIACESHLVDSALIEEGAEEPAPLGGFAGPDGDGQWAATVWVPVLGEGMSDQLAALLDAINPDEVVPVLPFPSINPRRGDDLVLEHRELLFDGLEVEPRNYLYASDSNPFDIYRAVSDLYDRYQASLHPLGAARFVLSTHSSKLLSVGVLLAALEKGIRVMHVSPSRYGLRAGTDPDDLADAGMLTDLWLAGAPYK